MIALTANRLILSDVCWGFVEASLNERQAEKFRGEEGVAQGDA
jgi:hypothetical protein